MSGGVVTKCTVNIMLITKKLGFPQIADQHLEFFISFAKEHAML